MRFGATLMAMAAASAARAAVLEGEITDAVTDRPVPGVSVFVGLDAGMGVTDETGRFEVTLADPGTYDLRAFKSGYELSQVFGVEVPAGRPASVEIQLRPLGSDLPLTRDPSQALEEIPEGEGTIVGEVRDADNDRSLAGVSIELRPGAVFSSLTSDADVRRASTDETGRYRFENVPSGYYNLRFRRDGYRNWTLEDVAVRPDEEAAWDVPLAPVEEEADADVFYLEDFVVSAEIISEQQYDFQVLRQQSVNLIDFLSAEDFARFAASDVAEAIQRIPGVTVEGGKFAVIRGLNERYSSTLLNGAPVPSPDPDRQSVPLDLFPSEIVNNLVVSKTFSAADPGNSAGGSLNILTNVFPEEFTVKLSVGSGFNSNSQERFLTDGARRELEVDFGNLGGNNELALEAITNNRITPVEENAPWDVSYALEIGGTYERWDRSLRYFFTFLQEWDYESVIGTEEDRFGVRPELFIVSPQDPPDRIIIRGTGDFAEGELSASSGLFDLTESSSEKTTSALAMLELDLDRDGQHRLNYTGFYVQIGLDRATLWNNGRYVDVTEEQLDDQVPERPLIELAGSLEAFNELGFWETNLVNETRELTTHQISGSHAFGQGSPLKGSWLLSTSETSQTENNSLSASGWELPDGTFQTGNTTDFPTDFVPTASWRETEETQDFGRADLEYRWDATTWLTLTPSVGVFNESTDRTISQEFFVFDLSSVAIDEDSFYEGFGTIEEAVATRFAALQRNVPPGVQIASQRDVQATYLSLRLELFEKLELVPGVRFETLEMTTATGEGDFFNYDLLRDSSVLPVAPTRPQENAAILGLPGVLPADFVGLIEEDLTLPTISLSYQATDQLRVLAGYSQTVARPSFKEFAYITTRDPVTLDYVSGNPTLEISHIESYDLRVEYVFNEGEDLLAFSAFRKEVEDPIERVTLNGTVLTDTFFNNPNDATIDGFEFEVRKRLDFFGDDSFLSHFTLGANLALIEAEVEVPESFRAMLEDGLIIEFANGSRSRRGGGLFAREGETIFTGEIGTAPETRPLFDQPEWIANANVSFDEEDWGTRITLAVFAQSQVLHAAGGYLSGTPFAVPDRYRKAFHRVDLSLRQRLSDAFSLSFSIKNLTDSERGIVYDEDLILDALDNRSFRSGRDYSISVSWEY